MTVTFSLSLFSVRNFTSGWFALSTSVALLPNIAESIPLIPYIFIISSIRRFSSDKTAIDATLSSLSFSTFTSSLSSFSSFRKISTRLSAIFPKDSFSSSATSSFKDSCTSASILKNLDHKYLTLEDIINESKAAGTEEETAEEAAAETDVQTDTDDQDKEPEKTSVYYVTDEVQQSQYINIMCQYDRVLSLCLEHIMYWLC